MHIKKPLLIVGAASSLAVASLAGVGLVSAQSSGSGANDLVEKIANKFNLNKDDVQAVFDEDRANHDAEMKQRNEERLNQAVANKKITAEQKDKILAKQAELKGQMDSEHETMRNKTEAERRTAMEAKRTELEKWAKDNGIPIEYLRPFGHPAKGGPDGPVN